MKKIILVILSLLSVAGCSLISKSPSKKVEEFFNKYQNLDVEVVNDLSFVSEGTDFTTEDLRSEYKKTMELQYSDLKYEITDESIDGDEAIVTVNITVYDFYKAQKEANNYLSTHSEEFETNDIYDKEKFLTYKINKMLNTSDRVEYTVIINLEKNDNDWEIISLSDETLDKIHGIYNYEND